MANKLSVSKPGLLAHANRAKLELTRLHDLLVGTTTSSQTQALSDIVDAKEACDDIIEDINALTDS